MLLLAVFLVLVLTPDQAAAASKVQMYMKDNNLIIKTKLADGKILVDGKSLTDIFTHVDDLKATIATLKAGTTTVTSTTATSTTTTATSTTTTLPPVFWTERAVATDGKTPWAQAQAKCATYSRELCAMSQVCPGGKGTKMAGIEYTDVNGWFPVADKKIPADACPENDWAFGVEYPADHATPSCALHQEMPQSTDVCPTASEGASYKHWRFEVVEAGHDPNSPEDDHSCFHAFRFVDKDGNTPYPTSVEYSNAEPYPSYTDDMLHDAFKVGGTSDRASPGAFWCARNKIHITATFASPQQFAKYKFALQANKCINDPQVWTISGSNDKSKWVPLRTEDHKCTNVGVGKTPVSTLVRGADNWNEFRVATMLVNPPNSARTFSSSLRNIKSGEEYANSMLDSTSGWMPFEPGASGVGEWLRIDLGKTMHVHGVVTQGLKSTHSQYTSKYEVLTSVDGSTFVSRGEFGICEDYSPCGPSVLLGSSSDTASDKIERLFSSSVDSRHVKIVIKEVGGDYAALRAAVVVDPAAMQHGEMSAKIPCCEPITTTTTTTATTATTITTTTTITTAQAQAQYPTNEAPASANTPGTPVYQGKNLAGKGNGGHTVLGDGMASWNVDEPDTWTVGVWVRAYNVASNDNVVYIMSKGSYATKGGMFFLGMLKDGKVFLASPTNLANMLTGHPGLPGKIHQGAGAGYQGAANDGAGYQIQEGKWTHIAAVFNSGCEKAGKKWPHASCTTDPGPSKYGWVDGITEATSDAMMDLYIDGVLSATYPEGGMSSSIKADEPDVAGGKIRPISIGSEGAGGSGYNEFNGDVACPYLSKRMLTPQEIAALAADTTACKLSE